MPPRKGTIKRPDVAARNRARREGKSVPPPRKVPPVPPGGVPPARDFTLDGAPPITKRTDPVPDEEAEFIKAEDLKKKWSPSKTPPVSGKGPEEAGFIAEMIAGLGHKIHDTEYGLTGHPVFQHSEADERIWKGVGKYVESQLDPAKYGIVILLVVLVGSEMMKVAVWGNDTMKQRRRPKGEPK